MIKTIIFDYDGVIVDSFSLCYEAYKVICRELGGKIPETIERFKAIYKTGYVELYPEINIQPKDFIKAGEIYKREILKGQAPIYNNIKEVLDKLSKKYNLVIVSATFEKAIRKKLNENDLTKYFSDIIAQKTAEGHVKKSVIIVELLKKLDLRNDEVIFIGDRTMDYHSVEKSGLKNWIIVEYGWGYDHEIVPKQRIVVNKPEDLLVAITEIENI